MAWSRHFWLGGESAFVIWPSDQLGVTARLSKSTDEDRLAGDWFAIAGDVCNVMDRYERERTERDQRAEAG